MKTLRKAAALVGLATFLLSLGAVAVQADTSAPPKDTVTSVAKELICDCPDCGKQSLDQCAKCGIGQKYRKVIDSQLKEGKTRQEILTYFANTYGEHMLGNPRPQGFNRTAVLLPGLVALLGLIPLSLILSHRRKATAAAPNAGGQPRSNEPAVEDPRVAAALKDYDF